MIQTRTTSRKINKIDTSSESMLAFTQGRQSVLVTAPRRTITASRIILFHGLMRFESGQKDNVNSRLNVLLCITRAHAVRTCTC